MADLTEFARIVKWMNGSNEPDRSKRLNGSNGPKRLDSSTK